MKRNWLIFVKWIQEKFKTAGKKKVIIMSVVILLAGGVLIGGAMHYGKWLKYQALQPGSEDPDVEQKYPGPWTVINDPSEEEPDEEPEENPGVVYRDELVHFLLLGMDKEEDCADSITVVTIHTVHKTARMLSVSRDFIVYWPSTNHARNGHSRISEIYRFGGDDLMMLENIKRLTGISPKFFVRVEFEGFVQIIDSLGGITVDGVRLNGEEALTLARLRTRAGLSVVQRMRNQNKIIMAVLREVSGIKTAKVLDLIARGYGYVKTNIGLGEAKNLYQMVEGFNLDDCTFHIIPIREHKVVDGKVYAFPVE